MRFCTNYGGENQNTKILSQNCISGSFSQKLSLKKGEFLVQNGGVFSLKPQGFTKKPLIMIN